MSASVEKLAHAGTHEDEDEDAEQLTEQMAATSIDDKHVSQGQTPSAAPTSAPSGSKADDQWEDITDRIPTAASLLRCGELLHHSSFSLKESMSALEVGDPKMDAAMHAARGTMDVDRALASGLIPASARDLTLFQQLEVIDELFACEVTSFTGAALAYSLYTCIYLHRLSLLRDCPLLYAYVLLQLKTIELTRQIIIQADIYSQEEFYYNMHEIRIGEMSIPQHFTNGHSTAAPTPASTGSNCTGSGVTEREALYGGLSMEEIVKQFDQQVAFIEEKLRQTMKERIQQGLSVDDENKPADESSSTFHLYKLLLNRFQFRKAWYEFNLLLRKPPFLLRTNLQHAADAERMIRSSLSIMASTQRGSCEKEGEAKRKQAEQAYEEESRRLLEAHPNKDDATQLPPFPKKPSSNLPPRPLSFGFDYRMTRCLVLTSPPRHISILHRRDVIAYMQCMMDHFLHFHSLPSIASSRSFHHLLDWFENWQKLQPNVLLRSHLWLYLQQGPYHKDDTAMRDPALDLFTALQEDADAPSNARTPRSPILNMRELLMDAHLRLSPSIQRLAGEMLEHEHERKKAQDATPLPDPLDINHPMTYHFFISRCVAPMYNYIKILLESPHLFRRAVLCPMGSQAIDGSSGGGNFIADWNVLMGDARMVDCHDWAARFLVEQEHVVAIPAEWTPKQRGEHPCLYYQHNCYSLISDMLTRILSSYMLHGLESGLYSSRELQTVYFHLEYILDLHLHNRQMCWRDANMLLPLKKSEAQIQKDMQSATSSKKPGKGGRAKSMKKLPLPSNPPNPTPRPLSYYACLMEAHKWIARGMLQLLEGLKKLRIKLPQQGNDEPVEVPAVDVPQIDPELCETWYAHRFGDLMLVPAPRQMDFAHYQEQLHAFHTNPDLTPAVVMSMAERSFGHGKSTISILPTAWMDEGITRTRTMQEVEYTKQLNRIAVANTVLTMTYKKQLTQAEQTGKRLKVAFRWEPHPAAPFQAAVTSRFMPFPIVTLVQQK